MTAGNFFAAVAVLALAAASCTQVPEGRTVCLNDYLTEEMTESDAEPAIRKALEECMKGRNSTLVLPGGTLPVKPEFCGNKIGRASCRERV